MSRCRLKQTHRTALLTQYSSIFWMHGSEWNWSINPNTWLHLTGKLSSSTSLEDCTTLPSCNNFDDSLDTEKHEICIWCTVMSPLFKKQFDRKPQLSAKLNAMLTNFRARGNGTGNWGALMRAYNIRCHYTSLPSNHNNFRGKPHFYDSNSRDSYIETKRNESPFRYNGRTWSLLDHKRNLRNFNELAVARIFLSIVHKQGSTGYTGRTQRHRNASWQRKWERLHVPHKCRVISQFLWKRVQKETLYPPQNLASHLSSMTSSIDRYYSSLLKHCSFYLLSPSGNLPLVQV